jgi:hypothetical protein
MKVEKGDFVHARLANDMEMWGIVEGQHGTGMIFTDITVIATKNFLPKDIKRYVLVTSDIVYKRVGKEKVEFT